MFKTERDHQIRVNLATTSEMVKGRELRSSRIMAGSSFGRG